MIDRETIQDALTERKVDSGSIVKIHYIHDPEGYIETIKVVEKLHEGETDTGIQEEPIVDPLGGALKDREVGDIVSFSFIDNGETISVQIIDIY